MKHRLYLHSTYSQKKNWSEKKKTNIHVLAKQIMPGRSSSQEVSEDIYKSQNRVCFKKITFLRGVLKRI